MTVLTTSGLQQRADLILCVGVDDGSVPIQLMGYDAHMDGYIDVYRGRWLSDAISMCHQNTRQLGQVDVLHLNVLHPIERVRCHIFYMQCDIGYRFHITIGRCSWKLNKDLKLDSSDPFCIYMVHHCCPDSVWTSHGVFCTFIKCTKAKSGISLRIRKHTISIETRGGCPLKTLW